MPRHLKITRLPSYFYTRPNFVTIHPPARDINDANNPLKGANKLPIADIKRSTHRRNSERVKPESEQKDFDVTF